LTATEQETDKKATDVPAILVEGVVKSYGFGGRFKALDGVNLRVEPGDIFALIGPNGAGKTTLMGCMLALLKPTSGRISIFGKPPDHKDVRSVSGFLPERPSFEPWMTPVEFLRFHQMLANRDRTDTATQDIQDALAAVELTEAAKRKVSKFSRGMLQRLGLAQVLVGKPQLCFLDEPTSGLDPPGMELVREVLVRFRAAGTTVVLNSHHLDEIEKSCTRFAFIRKGKMETQEAMSTLTSKVLIAKWVPGKSPEPELLLKSVTECGVALAECGDDYAKIMLNAKQDAPDVIAGLVKSGIPIEEIYFDRRGLSELFKPESDRRVPKDQSDATQQATKP
jgi:ABC-2 type transport system ATP-binding protein